jgi:hypothetical protein
LLALVAFLPLCLATEGANNASPRRNLQVIIHPGDDIMGEVEKNPPGTQFRITAGVYRLQSIIPKEGDSFIGEAEAIFNGAEQLSGFSRVGPLWAAAVQVTERSVYRGECTATHPACTFPTDLFVDNTPLLRVVNLKDVGPGTWYLDREGQKVFLSDNPAGHTVEISLRPFAIRGDAANVRIEGLRIEKYASEAGDGALDGRSLTGHMGQNWVVQNNVVTLNHGAGIRLGDGMQVLENKMLENGQLGIAGAGESAIVDGNEMARNNYAGYKYDWEAGGSKFAFTRNLVVRNNYAHDNDGPGLWTDLENENTLYDHNHTRSNRGAGIQHEVSYRATIRNNLIENDGFSDYHLTAPWYGAGIVIAGSSDVEVYGNTVRNCMNGIIGTQPQRELSRRGTPYLLKNLNVHDNIIVQTDGTAAGIVRAGALGDEVFDAWNNRFVDNQFQFADSNARYFTWKGIQLSYSDWKSQMRE